MTSIFYNWKTPWLGSKQLMELIFGMQYSFNPTRWYMEHNHNFFENEIWPQFFLNGRWPCFYLNRRWPHVLGNRPFTRPQNFYVCEKHEWKVLRIAWSAEKRGKTFKLFSPLFACIDVKSGQYSFRQPDQVNNKE